MLDVHFRSGIVLADAFFDRPGYASRAGISPPRTGCVVHLRTSFVPFKIDAFRLKNRGEFFERDHEINVAAHRAPGGLQFLRGAWSDKYDAVVGIFLFDHARRCDHRRKRARDLIRRFGEIPLDQHGPGRATGGKHKRDLARLHFRCVMMRFDRRADVGTQRHFEYVFEPQLH